MKTILSILCCILVSVCLVSAQEWTEVDRVLIIDDDQLGFTVLNGKNLELTAYCVGATDKREYCFDVRYRLTPVTDNGGGQQQPEWEPGADNDFNSCRNCHKDEVDAGEIKFLHSTYDGKGKFGKPGGGRHDDHKEDAIACVACHRRKTK